MRSFALRTWGLVVLSVGCLPNRLSPAQTFTNPAFKGADPSVILVDGTFYSVGSGCPDSQMNGAHGNICIRASSTLVGLGSATPVVVWRAPHSGPNSAEIWAPDLEHFGNDWYIYYAGASGSKDHQIFALVPDMPDKVLGSWSAAKTDGPAGLLPLNWMSHWAIDPDVFRASDSKLYLAFACRPSDNVSAPNYKFQDICLSAMSDPLHLTGQTVALSSPTQAWETRDYPTQEGPVGFTHNGITYIVYSASFSGSPDAYAEGILINTMPPQHGGKGNPLLNPASWIKKGPVFDGHHTAYGTASVALVDSSDHTELWNVYHGVNCFADCPPGVFGTWSSRSIRMQPAYWSAAGDLVLGYPVDIVTREKKGTSVPLELPSTDGKGSSILPPWGAAFGDAAEGDTKDGLKVGNWMFPSEPAAAARAVSSTSLDPKRLDQIFLQANPNLQNYELSTDLRLVKTGTDDPAAQFGVYAAYVDHRNFFVVMFNVTACGTNVCMATDAIEGGADRGWKNCALSKEFDPKANNHLAIEAVNGTFTIAVNNKPVSGPCQGRKFFLAEGQNLLHGSNGQVGVVVQDTEAIYTNFNVSYGVPVDSVTAAQSFNTKYNLNYQQMYAFQNQTTRMNLDNHCAGCKESGAQNLRIIQYPAAAPYPLTTSASQLWTLRSAGGPYFSIQSALSGKCLAQATEPHASPDQSITTPGKDATLQQVPCKGISSQNWLFISKGDGYFSIQNQASSLMLEIDGNTEGDSVHLREADGSSKQNWLLVIQ